MAVLGRKKYITGGQGDIGQHQCQASAVFIPDFLHCPDKEGPYRELRQYNSEPWEEHTIFFSEINLDFCNKSALRNVNSPYVTLWENVASFLSFAHLPHESHLFNSGKVIWPGVFPRKEAPSISSSVRVIFGGFLTDMFKVPYIVLIFPRMITTKPHFDVTKEILTSSRISAIVTLR